MMKEVTGILLLVLNVIKHSQEFQCGRVNNDRNSLCRCGTTEVLTEENSYGNYGYKRQCCGPDTCSFDDNSDVTCPDGIICNTRNWTPWTCGDVLIASENYCQCGLSSSYLYATQVWANIAINRLTKIEDPALKILG